MSYPCVAKSTTAMLTWGSCSIVLHRLLHENVSSYLCPRFMWKMSIGLQQGMLSYKPCFLVVMVWVLGIQLWWSEWLCLRVSFHLSKHLALPDVCQSISQSDRQTGADRQTDRQTDSGRQTELTHQDSLVIHTSAVNWPSHLIGCQNEFLHRQIRVSGCQWRDCK